MVSTSLGHHGAHFIGSPCVHFIRSPCVSTSLSRHVFTSLGHLVSTSLGHHVSTSLGHHVSTSLGRHVSTSLGHYGVHFIRPPCVHFIRSPLCLFHFISMNLTRFWLLGNEMIDCSCALYTDALACSSWWRPASENGLSLECCGWGMACLTTTRTSYRFVVGKTCHHWP